VNQGLLLGYQQRWVADKSPLKACEKGRRTGITWAEASDDVILAASSREAGGMNVYYFPQAKEDSIEYIETCGKWARAFDKVCSEVEEGDWEEELGEVLAADDPDKSIKTYKITFASGHRIVALSSAPSRARGKQGVFVLDEAAFHPNLKGVLKAVMASFLRGGRIRVISTHDGELNPFNELIEELRAGRRLGTVHRIPFREAVAEGMYRRICEVNGEPWTQEKEDQYVADAYALYGDDAAEELDAIPAQGEGAYLPRVLIEGVMRRDIPIVRWSQPSSFAELPKHIREGECRDWCDDSLGRILEALDPHLDHFFGSDFARTSDLSVFWPLQQTRMLDLATPFLLEMRNIPFEQQKQVLYYAVERLPRFQAGAMDARGNGQYLAEVAMQKFGPTRIAQVMLSAEWYRQHMPPFKAAFEDRTLSIPRDADVMADLRAIRREKGIAKVPDDARVKGADGRDRHGDSAVALALATYAVREMEPASIEYTSVPSKSERWERAGAGDLDDLYEDIAIEGEGAW
jgi:phage FluMu gp28-like protein